MRAFAAILLGMVSACRHAPPETETRVRDVTDFCCTAADCCGKRYFDIDGAVYMQSCEPRGAAKGRVPLNLQDWLLPDDGGTEEPVEASVAPQRTATAMPMATRPTDDDPPPGAVLVVERCGNPRNLSLCKRCYWRLPDGGIFWGGPLSSCL